MDRENRAVAGKAKTVIHKPTVGASASLVTPTAPERASRVAVRRQRKAGFSYGTDRPSSGSGGTIGHY